MNNLKYYTDSLAHNYDMFMPSEKKGKVIEHPNKKKKQSVVAVATKNKLVVPVLLTIAILGMICGNIFMRAEITRISSEINKENAIISELDSEITRLEVEVERKVSLNNLETAAMELGMQKRDKSQVKYIRVNNTNAAQTSDGKLLTDAE